MIVSQVKQLKLNVNNINSFLIKKNSESRILRLQKRSEIFNQNKQQEAKNKEKKIETLGIRTSLNKITSSILSGPMSLFDKIMNFAGTILLGVLINNLPRIIEKVQKFFSDNKWIISGIKFLFNALGEGIKSVINLVNGFSTFAGATQQQIIRQRDNITREIENLNVMVGSMDVSLLDFMKDLDKKPTTSAPKSTPRQTPFQRTGGYGRYSAPSQQKPISTSPTSPAATPSSPKPKGYARGGEVTRGSQVRGGRVSTPKIKSQTFTQGETGRAKAARQSINYFEVFKTTADNFDTISKIDEENNKKFEELAINIKSMPSLFDDNKIFSPGSSKPPGPPINDLAVPVDPEDVIGTVGYTGRVVPAGPGGSHIHIENMANYKEGIPASVKNNILISGVPMPQRLRFTSGIGQRWGREHKGEDYAGDPNQNITLTGGLKFVSYIPDQGDGYGNKVIIQSPDGKKYTLNHLNSGPSPVAAKKLKEKQLRLQQQQDTSRLNPTGKTQQGKASWYGPGFQGNKTASGEIFDTNQYTAAHPTLPFGTKLKVTNSANGKSVIVTINDRGPFAVDNNGKAIRPLRPHPSRVIDLSKASMDKLGGSGVIDVKLEILKEKSTPKPGDKSFIGPVPNKSPELSLNNDSSSQSVAFIIRQKEEVAVPIPMQFPVPSQTVAQAPSSPSLSALWM